MDEFIKDLKDILTFLVMAFVGFILFYVILRYQMKIDVRSSIQYGIKAGAIWALIAWFAQFLPKDISHKDLFKNIKNKKRK